MNLMFRKNFQDQKCGGVVGGKGGGVKATQRPPRRSREHGYTAMDEYHYRTHIFFSPHSRNCTSPEYEGLKNLVCWLMF